MSRLQKSLSLLFLSVFITISVFIVPQAQAVGGPPLLFNMAVQPKTIFDYGKEYCDKRSGDLMNLETWYSGKCAPGVDTISGDGVGFSDIVFLQGIEYLIGPQYGSFIDMITNIIKGLEAASNLKQSNASPAEIQNRLSSGFDQGIIPQLAKITTGLVNTKPASSIDYLAYVSSNLKNHHVIKEAFAAGPGYGFSSLAPILPVWQAFRNVSYLLFALGFVLYGVMIMFRVKIDSKTAATIQLAIPKLIATLLMITFSYAIVGFLIDLSTIATAMAINVLKVGGLIVDDKHFLIQTAGGNSWLGAVGSMLLNGFTAFVASPFIVFNLLIGGATGMAVAAFIGTISLAATAGFFGVIMIIIVMIAVIISYFKLIMKLFQAFFSVIINLIFSPIILLGNLMPGSTSFGDWLRSIYGNLAVFPVAVFFLTFSYILMCQPLLSFIGAFTGLGGAGWMEGFLGVKQLSTLSNIWTPPMTIPTGATTGTAMGSSGSLMLATIGFGLLMMASKYCEMVEKALKVPPFPYGAAIGEALKAGRAGEKSWADSGMWGVPAVGRLRTGLGKSEKVVTSIDDTIKTLGKP